jgi:branched-chain amino acid transport system ATP-binding protein
VSRPWLLLLDEPSLGLSPVVSAQIMAFLRDRKDRTGLTVLLVEQNVHSALEIADVGIVLALGRVVAEGPAGQLRADESLRHKYLGF